ncbi:arsenate reductase family protein [Streptococcus sp. zg-JUN1979]|uniref:arsenate reductase family protein n=1 Tax=Streptococcus sp. zg-JUN1979 TaxID=3391450 RepID=UPI0039A67F99
MFTFYQYPPCSTCKRAKKELDQLALDYHDINIKVNPPSEESLLAWMSQGDFTLKQFFNTSGQRYRELGLKDKLADMSQAEAAALLASDGMLIKRPLLVKDDQLLQIGYRSDYETLLS